MNTLKKYILSDFSDDVLNIIDDKLIKLKMGTNNFGDLIVDEKISLNPNTSQLFYDFLYAYKEVYSCIDAEKFLDEMREKCSVIEMNFWNIIIAYFDFVKLVKKQTTFLKEMEMSDFRDIVQYTFNNNVLYNNFIRDYKQWNSEEIMIVQKTINSFLASMIENFLDFDTTIYDLDVKFGFSREKYELIWDMCEKNKTYLMLKNITENLKK